MFLSPLKHSKSLILPKPRLGKGGRSAGGGGGGEKNADAQTAPLFYDVGFFFCFFVFFSPNGMVESRSPSVFQSAGFPSLHLGSEVPVSFSAPTLLRAQL